MIEQAEVAARLRSAFPRSAVVDVDAALGVLPLAETPPSAEDIGKVAIAGEALRIPMRIYSPEPTLDSVDRLSGSAKVVLACLFTRHHSGVVRQAHLEQLFATEAPWVPPYVFQLVGEQVVEIAALVLEHIDQLRNDRYASFAQSNPVFIRTIRHRLVSYWDRYYRNTYPELSDYPAYQVINGLALWEKREAQRNLVR